MEEIVRACSLQRFSLIHPGTGALFSVCLYLQLCHLTAFHVSQCLCLCLSPCLSLDLLSGVDSMGLSQGALSQVSLFPPVPTSACYSAPDC
jgi:hypothetical protein